MPILQARQLKDSHGYMSRWKVNQLDLRPRNPTLSRSCGYAAGREQPRREAEQRRCTLPDFSEFLERWSHLGGKNGRDPWPGLDLADGRHLAVRVVAQMAGC